MRSGYLLGGDEVLCDDDIVETIVDTMLKQYVEEGFTIHIVEGEARGADIAGFRYAKKRGYDCVQFPADWNKYGKRAGFIRNAEMYGFLKDKEHRSALLFWDGKSRGTRDNFIRARNTGVKVSCFQYELRRFLTEDEIERICDDIESERRYY